MIYKNRTNGDIVPLAQRGARAVTATYNMSTVPGYSPYGGGYLPHGLQDIFRGMRERISQTIYSYATPIALCIDGVWVIPDVKYSPTTSTKHQSQLWCLVGSVSIPWDATREDVERIIARIMVYTGKGYKPGPNWEPGI